MREVCVITGARSEYWLLRPVLTEIRAQKSLRLYLVATGMHLLESRGLTVRQMIEDGFTPHATAAMYEEGGANHAAALGRGIAGIGKILARRSPAFTLVLGDRLEAFAGAAAAAALGLVLVHLHGGEVTPGAPLDESLRHAITRLAHIHCAPTRAAMERLRRMGEQEFRIHLTGSPAIDALKETGVIPWPELCVKLGFDTARPVLICIQHPEVLKSSKAGKQFAQTLAALGSLKQQTAVIYPNNDPGSEKIVREIEKLRSESWVRVFESLPHREFVSLMSGAAAMVGNSSAAFVEAPYLGLPALNVGERNRGRERVATVLNCKCNHGSISKALEKVLSSPRPARGVYSPYGDRQAAERIVEVLLTTRRSAKLLAKELTY